MHPIATNRGRDRYGRTGAHGTDANAVQVRAGMAWVLPRFVIQQGHFKVRVIGGALIRACSLVQIALTPLGLVLSISGVLTALTGLIGFCPASAMAGRKSLEGLP